MNSEGRRRGEKYTKIKTKQNRKQRKNKPKNNIKKK